jgi:hypothetical protein
MNKNIYVIATETQFGYEEDSTKANIVTEICYNFGAWNDRIGAELKCVELHTKDIPEDDSENSDKYFVLELKVND